MRDRFAAFAERMQEGDRVLPRCVVAELEAFLRCGVLACGLVRARCAGCGHLVALTVLGPRLEAVAARHVAPA